MKSNTALLAGLCVALTCCASLAPLGTAHAQVSSGAAVPESTEARGLRIRTDAATPGYTLFAPLTSGTTYLIDLDGRAVRTWTSEFLPGAWVYMLDNGHLLRGGREPETHGFSGGGQGGRFQEFDFEGNLLWDFSLNTEDRLPHHDVAVLPNGNLLAIVWERKSVDDARQAGRREGFIPADGVWSDVLVELEPERPNGARVVWEWHAWDHIIQHTDPRLERFAEPARHPELIDLNGDTVGMSEPPEDPTHDVFHINSVAYNPDLDQIIVSVPSFNEIWIIDHSTTIAQAASSAGGRSGMGGDLLYRWGNPQAYGRGGPDDRTLGFEHDARWIPEGRPGAGNVTVFSNRTPGSEGPYTKVYELRLPVARGGRYAISADGAFGPTEPVWTYSAPGSFEATYISGAERLATGNTLISSGPQGRLFEVTAAGDIVWEFWSPYSGAPGAGGEGARANPFAIFRAIRISHDHPALEGRNLAPLDPQPSAAPDE
jgi:hypothetical protein